MAPMLAADSTVYAVDALNIGESERVPGIDPGLEGQADRLAAFMHAEGIKSADILGTSHGGALALMLAARHPERVRSLILHAPANPFSNIADPMIHFYQSPLGRWFAHRFVDVPDAVKAVGLGRMYGNEKQLHQQGSLEIYTRSLRIPGTVDYVLSLLAGWFDDMHKLKAALNAVRGVPALLIWGDRDSAVSVKSGETLKHCFDQAELVVLPGVGHLPYEECPALLAQTISPFLRAQRAERHLVPKLVTRRNPA
jgi:pimeloyl-ACP methyl ester carboxylesterase